MRFIMQLIIIIKELKKIENSYKGVSHTEQLLPVSISTEGSVTTFV